jgi:hypothetical protein
MKPRSVMVITYRPARKLLVWDVRWGRRLTLR